MSDLFGLYVAEDVVVEHSRSAEELVLGARQLDAGTELKFDEMQSANEVRQLKQSIARWLDVAGEFHGSSKASLKHFMKHASDR